ncbi:hypothetical protein QR680_006691 [Steinernema hermaphroditum]|uniref:Uncharacterized protein n=1 Tax=Steinernema hermaphroditum TaxID=289476 RepID=A0AA39HWA8_9BILA|nr:hypothetical protein QR680_006691 [Steinernema hermaphroditum]
MVPTRVFLLAILSLAFVTSLPFYELESIGMPEAVQCFPTPCYEECPKSHPRLAMKALISIYCLCCKKEVYYS